jgi:hypothetical protein
MPAKPFGGLSEQPRAAVHRRADAQALFEKERWRGAMYLAGYAIECTLKRKLMEKFGCRNLDELEPRLKGLNAIPGDVSLYDHRLDLYLRAAGGLDRLKNDWTAWRDYNLANRWLPSWRYNPDLSCREDSEDFLGAVDGVLGWLEGNL